MPSKKGKSPKGAVGRSSPPTSAGCLVTRVRDGVTEVLLVHPRGATFRKPLFGIPKGEVEPGETPEETALRETREETGLIVQIREDLGTVRQQSGKLVHGFWATVDPASEAAIDERGRCRFADATEVDSCRFYPLEKAEALMIPAQREFLHRLRQRLHQPVEQRGGA